MCYMQALCGHMIQCNNYVICKLCVVMRFNVIVMCYMWSCDSV